MPKRVYLRYEYRDGSRGGITCAKIWTDGSVSCDCVEYGMRDGNRAPTAAPAYCSHTQDAIASFIRTNGQGTEGERMIYLIAARKRNAPLEVEDENRNDAPQPIVSVPQALIDAKNGRGKQGEVLRAPAGERIAVGQYVRLTEQYTVMVAQMPSQIIGNAVESSDAGTTCFFRIVRRMPAATPSAEPYPTSAPSSDNSEAIIGYTDMKGELVKVKATNVTIEQIAKLKFEQDAPPVERTKRRFRDE